MESSRSNEIIADSIKIALAAGLQVIEAIIEVDRTRTEAQDESGLK